ncbi:MAG: type II secretion system protein [Gemmatimonadota bacterium]
MADRRGFTLIELLVAIVLGSIVTTVLFQLIAGQGRFVEMQSAREEVQQNSRAAIELISSELRSLPGGDALVRASADSVTMRTARLWGVVCAVNSATSIDVVVPAVPGASLATNTGTGIVANVGTAAAPLWTNAVSVTGIGGPVAVCGTSALPAGAETRTLTVASVPENAGTAAAAGDPVYLYDQVTYRTGTSSGVPGLWIQRRVGDVGSSTNQPMAGPIQDAGGLRFEYFAGAATAPLATPILDAAARSTVTRILVSVDAVSRSDFGGDALSRADTVVVALRNRL